MTFSTSSAADVTRREFIRKAGRIAWATPLIYTALTIREQAQAVQICADTGIVPGSCVDCTAACEPCNPTCPTGTECQPDLLVAGCCSCQVPPL
jgi:hypothetical protein